MHVLCVMMVSTSASLVADKKKINTGCFTKLYILHLDIGMYM